MKQQYYEEEMMVKDAITAHKKDQEIGMPDVESELKRVKQMARRKQTVLYRWRRVAAVSALVIFMAGLAGAYVYYHQADNQASTTYALMQEEVKTTTLPNDKDDEEEVKASENLSLCYEKASLEQIVVDLTAFYHLEKPVFENRKAAHKYKMHVTINSKGSIEDAVALLNQFSSIRIELSDNRLIMK